MFRVATARVLPAARPTQLLTPRALLRPLRVGKAPGGFVRFQSTSAKEQAKGIKALVKEYGYSALGVYLFLSALDLPVCYLLVHSLGREQIEVYENKVKQYFGYGKTDAELQRMQEIKLIEEHAEAVPQEEGLFSWFLWTEFAIAYGIHKSVFIFVRVPLTAALTPSIVKLLRGWGFKIGLDKLATTASIAKDNLAAAANPKFGTRPTRGKRWWWFF